MSNYRDEFLGDNYYLIYNQGFNNNILFGNTNDYKTFILYVIANLLEYPNLSISAYCILPKSFYLVVKNKTKGMDISNFMRKIQVSYAMYFKKQEQNKDLKGVPVFQGRFKSENIKREELETKESYISFKPINDGIVEDIKNWPYTSVHQVINTGYDHMNQTHIKIYNEGRTIKQ